MHILITGGFGFVGARLAAHLCNVGHTVVLASRTERKAPEWLPLAKVVCIDWQDQRCLERSCSGVDVIVHAAGMNAQDCYENPVAALEANGVATARLVAAAEKCQVRRFVYLSTAHVYTATMSGVVTESSCPKNQHPYATSHRAGEDAVLFASSRGNIEGIVLRLSNVFGRPEHKNVNCWMLLTNELCRQAVEGKNMILRSRGGQQRDFVSMLDVCRVIQYFVEDVSGVAVSRAVNVGSGSSITVFEMAERVLCRCRVVLGFSPILQFLSEDNISENENFSYRSDLLINSGWSFGADDDEEIDQLLLACATWFRPRSGK